LEQLHYRTRDRILIVVAILLLVASVGLSLFGFGKFWVPPGLLG
jgi:energy-coupling factor transport system permease protein